MSLCTLRSLKKETENMDGTSAGAACIAACNPELEEEIRDKHAAFHRELEKVLIGEKNFKQTLGLAIFSGSHVIAESAAGEGKSLGMDAVARALSLSFKKVQGTNDLLPEILRGYVEYRTNPPVLVKGPLLSYQLILLDEINRVPEKTKSALLDVMEKPMVSIPDWKEPLERPRPFILLGTMNPGDREKAVYQMTIAELNRFGLRIRLEGKTLEETAEIAVRDADDMLATVNSVMTAEELVRYQSYIKELTKVSGTHPMVNYIARLSQKAKIWKDASETHPSSRAVRSFWLTLTTYRVLNGLPFLTPEHVAHLIRRSWSHRIVARDEDRKDRMLDQALESVSPIPSEAERCYVG